MPRHTIDPAISRTVNRKALSALRNAHKEEFKDLLDVAYAEVGVESPRVRRRRLQDEADQARLLRKQKAAAKQAEKIAAAKALLEAEGITVLDGSEALAE